MKSILPLALAAVWLASAPTLPAQQPAAPPQPLKVTIDSTRTSAPVSKYEYGMFIENLGTLVYRSLWSEMLDDRKFYFPITSAEPAASGQRQGGGFPGMQLRKWRPVGPDGVVTMDKDQPFVGGQSPRVALDGNTPHGIRQSGLALVRGRQYTGHIWLRGAPGAKVSVSLVWGAGSAGRQTIPIAALRAAYTKFPLHFTAGADSADAALEITGSGSGSFHIGAVSLMPADNVNGFRPEVIALLRQLHSGFWRLPGGDAHSAAEEVEYINGAVTTRLGALRARNGHPQPYRVRFWDIGNEPYGVWQLGRTDLKYYVLKHNEFAAAMRSVDPSIILLASGNMPEPMDLTGAMRAQDVDNMKAVEGTPEDWTGGLLEHCWGNFDGITQHWYARSGRHFDVQKAKNLPLDAPTDDGYVQVGQTPLECARYPANIVRLQAQAWERYQQRFPAMLQKKIFLSIDEYAYFGGTFSRVPDLKLALAYGMIFNEMLRHTDFLTMSAHTMGVSTLDYTPTAATLNTTGLIFRLYGDSFPGGSLPVALTGSSPQPASQYPIGGDQPETNSGSPTYPLDMFAALTPDRKFLTLAVVNATASAQPFDLSVTGLRLAGNATMWEMTGPNLEAADRVGQPPQVEVKESALGPVAQSIVVPPISVDIYRFPVATTQ